MNRKTGTIKLETGRNVVEIPVCAQVLGFDAVGTLRLVYDAPADLVGIEKAEFHVVRAGDTFIGLTEEDGTAVFVGTASPVGSRPTIIYQVHRWSR